jgi:P27 family predicted phage terminase small subunit
MENGKVLSINHGKDTLLKCPKPPIYLTDEAKVHYKAMGAILAKNDRLKDLYLTALEVYAESMAQWEFSTKEIKKANADKFGTGYIQKFSSGAANVSVYVTLKDKAEDSLFKCFKQFGLDPKSEKDLKNETTDPNQMSLFEQLLAKKNG